MMTVCNVRRSRLILVSFIALLIKKLSLLIRDLRNMNNMKLFFGFLFNSNKLHLSDDSSLNSCWRLAEALKNGEKCDVQECDLYDELKLFQQLLPMKR